MKRIVLLFSSLCFCFQSSSQTSESATDFGFIDLIGSARYIGMGGAFTAVGGDLSSVKDNPAGAGIKRMDEFSLTGAMNYQFNNTNANGLDIEGRHNNFSLPDINYLTVNKTEDRYWKSINFTIGVNRINNLNSSVEMEGSRVETSYITQLKDNANKSLDLGNKLKENDRAFQGYQTYLLDSNEKVGFFSALESDQHEFNYLKETDGKIYDIALSVSSAYKDKLFIGGSLAFPVLNYNSFSRLIEDGFAAPKNDWLVEKNITSLQAAHFETIHNVNGSGINAKLGVIYRLSKEFRVGASIHTPTYFNIENVFSYKTKGYFKDLAPRTISYNGVTFYDLVIPAKYNFGMAYVFGKKGMISMDYNFRNFSKSNYIVPINDVNYVYFNGDPDQEIEGVNAVIARAYGGSHTIKVGGEFNVKPFRIRGGFVHQTSPSTLTENLKTMTFTGGIGFSKREFSCDIAYAYSKYEDSILLSPYRETSKGRGTINRTNQQYVLTFGYKIK